MDTNELLNGPDYWLFEIQHNLYDLIRDYLEKNNLTQTEFASLLGVGKSYISQILNGNFDHKLSKFVELALATGNVPFIKYMKINDAIKKYDEGTLFSEDVKTYKVKANIQDSDSNNNKFESSLKFEMTRTYSIKNFLNTANIMELENA